MRSSEFLTPDRATLVNSGPELSQHHSTVVVVDTSPFRYLIIIGLADILPKLYGEVLLPRTVALELNGLDTPEPVSLWTSHPPP